MIDDALPKDLTGQTFSAIFGTQSSALEMFILKRDLMGPSWLCIEDPHGLGNSVGFFEQRDSALL